MTLRRVGVVGVVGAIDGVLRADVSTPRTFTAPRDRRLIKVPKPDDTEMYRRRPKGGPRANLLNRLPEEPASGPVQEDRLGALALFLAAFALFESVKYGLPATAAIS
ncbi:MAG: hypothetical protein JWQ95_5528 [Sphaerisporangium sp.]|nr:hypothetical protein [Sphaerisporangium sp.]